MIPIKPPSSDRERKEWERQVSRRLTELQILESQTVKREQKSTGTILEVKPGAGGGASTRQVWL